MLKSQTIVPLVIFIVLLLPTSDSAEVISVRHVEGVTFGFLVLRTVDGKAIAYGNLKQVVKGYLVTDELVFHFKDGSLYDEITNFTQKAKFRLVRDQVVQKGPSFKQDSESGSMRPPARLPFAHPKTADRNRPPNIWMFLRMPRMDCCL